MSGFAAHTLQLLDRYWRRVRITSGPILLSRTGERLSMAALYLAVRRRSEQAGIKGPPAHTFRHTTGTRLLESGMQEADVRVFMGWSRGSRMLERDTQSGPAERALEVRGTVRLV